MICSVPLTRSVDRPKLLAASYFGRLRDALTVLAKAPAEGLALASPNRAAPTSPARGLPGKRLVEGVVNGRNIWINDYEQSLATLGTLLGLADRVEGSASCSLLHVPPDATVERDMAQAPTPLLRSSPRTVPSRPPGQDPR